MEWVKHAIPKIVLIGTDGVDPTDQVVFTFYSRFYKGSGVDAFKLASEVAVDDVREKISSM